MKILNVLGLTLGLLSPFTVQSLLAAPDGRLAGYWSTGPDDPTPVSFSFGILGKWTIVTQHQAGTPDLFKLRYTVENTDDSGTFTADESLEKYPAAPRTIRYVLQNSELRLIVQNGQGVQRFLLNRSTPPSKASSKPAAPASTPVASPPVAPPTHAMRETAPLRQPKPDLLGSWATEAGVEKQLSLHIAWSRTADVMINQQWIKGSEHPLVSKKSDYMVNLQAGRGTLTKVKPDYEGSLIPPRLEVAFVGPNLVVTVDDGHYAGQYRLSKVEK